MEPETGHALKVNSPEIINSKSTLKIAYRCNQILERVEQFAKTNGEDTDMVKGKVFQALYQAGEYTRAFKTIEQIARVDQAVSILTKTAKTEQEPQNRLLLETAYNRIQQAISAIIEDKDKHGLSTKVDGIRVAAVILAITANRINDAEIEDKVYQNIFSNPTLDINTPPPSFAPPSSRRPNSYIDGKDLAGTIKSILSSGQTGKIRKLLNIIPLQSVSTEMGSVIKFYLPEVTEYKSYEDRITEINLNIKFLNDRARAITELAYEATQYSDDAGTKLFNLALDTIREYPRVKLTSNDQEKDLFYLLQKLVDAGKGKVAMNYASQTKSVKINKQLEDYILKKKSETAAQEPNQQEITLKNLETEMAELETSFNIERALAVFKKFYPDSNSITDIPPQTINFLLEKSNDHEVREAIAYLGLQTYNLERSSSVSSPIHISLELGSFIKDKDIKHITEARKIVLGLIKNNETNSYMALKAYVEGMIRAQDYQLASNNLLGILADIESTSNKGKQRAYTTRILKGLVTINNPKGKSLATQLYAKLTNYPHIQNYLSKILFESEHWDLDLEVYLKNKKTRREIGEEKIIHEDPKKILTLMINELGITPTLSAYKLLEGSNLIKGTTTEDRVQFAKNTLKDLGDLSRDEVLERFRTNPELAKLYYLFRIGQNTYSVTNKYTTEMFIRYIAALREIPLEKQTLSIFKEVLEHSGLTQDESSLLIKDLQEGKPPIVGDNRTITFSSEVEYGSSYEKALRRLQDVWLRELKSLLIARAAAKTPRSITESLSLLDNEILVSENHVKVSKTIKTLKLDSEYIGKPDILEIVKDLKNRLKTTYKQTGDKQSLRQLDTLSDFDVIKTYLKDLLASDNKSPATAEWISHLNEVLTDLNTASGSTKTRQGKRLELTFLDKSRDFVRAIRFTDAAQCCFNSASDTTIDSYAARYPVRLNKDPLSFIIDLKEENSNEILGFVFGRMGINPQTGRPVIMLNGIYSQIKGENLVNSILSIIEEKMAPRLHADTIVIASKYGGAISQPEGYQNKSLHLFAIRAIGKGSDSDYYSIEDEEEEIDYEEDYGEDYEEETNTKTDTFDKDNELSKLSDRRYFKQNPDNTYTYKPNNECEKHTYDDIGYIANGLFKFRGYYKRIPIQ